MVQKLLRAVPGVGGMLPDLADDDFRKSFQDTWYGTNEKAQLPEWMQSRSSSRTPQGESEGEAEAASDAASVDGEADAAPKESGPRET